MIVVAAVAAAIVINLAIYAIGRASGGEFLFTASSETAEVDALTVAGFTAVPLSVGMALAALLSLKWPWIIRVALVVGPVLALVTIAIMTIPADFDLASTIALALCHVALVPVMIVGLLAMSRRTRRR